MRRIIDISAKIVVMSEKGHELLRSVHNVPTRKIEVIPHGIPDFPFLETHHAKAKFGFAGKIIILTFGLLSPNKGIEIMLDAMPGIIKLCPNVVYVVLGATHPKLVREQGEAYRESLTARVQALGIENHVVFFNQFVDQATLLELHFDVRRLRDALSQRSPNDVGHTGLQLWIGKGSRIDTLLACQGTVKRRVRHSRSFWRCQSAGHRDRRPADERRPPSCHAQTRLRGEPIDDLGANGQALSWVFETESENSNLEYRFQLMRSSPGERATSYRRCGSGISSRFATARA